MSWIINKIEEGVWHVSDGIELIATIKNANAQAHVHFDRAPQLNWIWQCTNSREAMIGGVGYVRGVEKVARLLDADVSDLRPGRLGAVQ